MSHHVEKCLRLSTVRQNTTVFSTAPFAAKKYKARTSPAMIKLTTLQRAARLVAQSDKRRAVQGAIDAFKRNDARALDEWFEVLNMAEKKLSCAQN